MIGDSIKNTNYQATFYQNYEFGRPQTTNSAVSQYPVDSTAIPFDANFILSNHLQKPVFEQNKYNELYCNSSMYGGGLYNEPSYSDEMAMQLVSPEWRQTLPQPSWDIKVDSKSSVRSSADVDEHYFNKSNINNAPFSQNIGPPSDYHSLDGFPRNINSTKGSQYFYPAISFGNAEAKSMSRINSNYSSDNSSFSSLSPKMSFDMNKSSKTLPDLSSSQTDYDKLKKNHIKKPLNAFMLFMKEMRSRVVAECTLKESAAINQILGRRWHALTREEQTKYYEMARKEKELHQQLYPNWSARDNYASHTKRKKKRTNTLFQMSYFNHANSFKNSHPISCQKFQPDLTEQTMLDQNPLIFSNKRGILSNHNFFYKPGSPYHIDPLLALHYGSPFSFSSNQPCLNSTWPSAEITDSSLTVNKECQPNIQNPSSNEIASERIQTESNIPSKLIPDDMVIDLDMVDRSLGRKPHLVTESVF